MQRFLLGVLASALCGCGGDVCARNSGLVKDLNTKTSACPTLHIDGQVDSCATKLKSCSAEDQAKLARWYDCMESLPTCAAGQEDAWFNQFSACAAKNLNGASQACIDAFATQ